MTRRSRAQGSIYRRRKAGKLEPSWTISYRANGRRITERAFADRPASEQLLASRLRESAREEVGLLDPYRKHRARPVVDHVVDFLAGVRSRNRTPKHVEVLQTRIEKALAGMGASTLGQVDLAHAEKFLAGVLERHSPKTRDHYASSLRQFGAWLEDADRWPRNLFARLKRVSRPADAKRERLALTAEQLLALVAAAEQRPLQQLVGVGPCTRERAVAEGRRRGTLYLFSALTGLRASECAGIRWCDLELTGDSPRVSPRPATTKARRDEPLPLVEPLVGRLQALRAEVAQATGGPPRPTALVFRVPQHIAQRLRDDAAWAEIPVVDHRGRRLDFHALRATCATLLARAGVPVQLARRLMRHSSPAMTARHYEKLADTDLRAGAAELAKALAAAAPEAAVTATQRRTTDSDDIGRAATRSDGGGRKSG